MPPSIVLKKEFSKVKKVTEEFIKEIAENVMLSTYTDDTQIWLKHLTNVIKKQERRCS